MTDWNVVYTDGTSSTVTNKTMLYEASDYALSHVPANKTIASITKIEGVVPTPTMMQSPDGTWWAMGVDDAGATIWSPV